MKKTLLLFFALFATQIFGVDFGDFDPFQGIFTREEVEERIQKYLVKEPSNSLFYRLTDDALVVGNLADEKVDYTLKLATTCQGKKVKAPLSLKGAKIAIDPGHFGGPYAELEERNVKIPKALVGTDQDVQFDEGSLTFLTAVELKRLLEAEGAIVCVTRSAIGLGAIDKSFFAWLENQPALWKSKESLTTLFRNYNREDLRVRAKKINEFKPDVTVIIHYNAHDESEKQQTITHANYNLVFIPGGFRKKELSTSEERYEFIRLLVTDDLEESLKLSQCLVHEFVTKLKVPLITENDRNSYINSSCLKISEGVYSRNLALTRMVHGPLCYGETLIQNNEHEALKLDARNIDINNITCSSRIREVAEAYFEGIKRYFQ